MAGFELEANKPRMMGNMCFRHYYTIAALKNNSSSALQIDEKYLRRKKRSFFGHFSFYVFFITALSGRINCRLKFRVSVAVNRKCGH